MFKMSCVGSCSFYLYFRNTLLSLKQKVKKQAEFYGVGIFVFLAGT
jgi:hypothetical protein